MLTIIILAIVLVSIIVRLLAAIFRVRSRFFYGCNNSYGYGSYYRPRRHHRLGGGLLTLLALVALDRLFARRF